MVLAQKCSGKQDEINQYINRGLNLSPNHQGLLLMKGIFLSDTGAFDEGLDLINQ